MVTLGQLEQILRDDASRRPQPAHTDTMAYFEWLCNYGLTIPRFDNLLDAAAKVTAEDAKVIAATIGCDSAASGRDLLADCMIEWTVNYFAAILGRDSEVEAQRHAACHISISARLRREQIPDMLCYAIDLLTDKCGSACALPQ